MGDAADDAVRRAEAEVENEGTPTAASPPDVESEIARHETADEGEVRPDEFSRGIDDPVGKGFLSAPVVEELKQPLNPNRIRTRKGRGRDQYEYLAGHDVKRRMNEIFGFGGWSTLIENQEQIAAVQVEREGRQGWHVGYRATVRVTIKTLDGGVASYEDSGYGDGVEYGQAALVTACELALKEAVTDAFKRACTYLGDQFGLILYAKDDEKKRIVRDQHIETGEYVRQETQQTVPRGWPELFAAWESLLGGGPEAVDAREVWMTQPTEAFYGVSRPDLNGAQRAEAGQKLATAYLSLMADPDALDEFGIPTRVAIQAALANVFGGVNVEGPPWRLSKDEKELLPYADWKQTQNGDAETESEPSVLTADVLDETIEFGEETKK